MKPPCKDCPDRKPACHDSCERYGAWKAERQQAYVNRNKKKQIEEFQFLFRDRKRK